MNPFKTILPQLAISVSLQPVFSVWMGGGKDISSLLTQRRNLSYPQQNPSVPSSFPFQKSLCSTHLCHARHVALVTFPVPCSSFLHTFPMGFRFGMQISFLLPSFSLVNSSQSDPGAWGGTEAGRGRVSLHPCGKVSQDGVGRIHLSGKSEVSPEHPVLLGRERQ